MKTRKLLCAILAVLTCAAAFNGVLFNIPVAAEAPSGIQSGVFSYAVESLEDGYTFNRSAKYYYSDSYFSEPAENYNPHLATMSMCLAISAFSILGEGSDPDYKNQSSHAVSLLEDIGFTDITPNADMYIKPTTQTMGAVAARKTAADADGEYTLVALTLRGGAYGSEWAENLIVGSAKNNDGNHQGFYEARDRTLAFLNEYISDISGRVKVWVVGFSRAAAVAGLVGAWLDDNLTSLENENVSLTLHDIYAYTFEAPMATARENTLGKDYSNIHNIVGANDIVTKVTMSGSADYGWDFVRVGEESVYDVKATPDVTTDSLYEKRRALILNFLRYMNPDLVAIQADIEDELFGVWQDAAVYEALNYLSAELASVVPREKYVLHVQPFLSDFIGQVIADGESRQKFIEALEAAYDKYSFGLDQYLPVSMSMQDKLDKNIIDVIIENKDAIKPILIVMIKDVLSNAEITYNEGELMAFLYTMLDIFSYKTADLVYTLIALLSQESPGILANHFPELPLAWLMASDSYYGGIDEPMPYAITRIVEIKNAEAVVKDSSGATVFSSVSTPIVFPSINDPSLGGVTIQRPESRASSGFAIKNKISEGTVTLFLPSNESYTIEILPKGIMEYSVIEHSVCDGQDIRRVLYTDISSEDTSLVGEVPAISADKVVFYTLCDSSGGEISGDDSIISEIRRVDLSSDFADASLSGEGEYFAGERATVFVNEHDCHTFVGWYSADTLLSSERTYSFTVRDSVELVARFEENHTPSDWITDEPAAVGSYGAEHRECVICGITLDERVITSIEGDVPEQPVNEGEQANNDLILPIFIACISVTAIASSAVVIITVKKRKKIKQDIQQ